MGYVLTVVIFSSHSGISSSSAAGMAVGGSVGGIIVGLVLGWCANSQWRKTNKHCSSELKTTRSSKRHLQGHTESADMIENTAYASVSHQQKGTIAMEMTDNTAYSQVTIFG